HRPAEVGVQALAVLRTVFTVAITLLGFEGEQPVESTTGSTSGGTYTPVTEAAGCHCNARPGVVHSWRAEVDRASQGAGAVGQCVGAVRDSGEAGPQRIQRAVVVVAIGCADRQAVLEEL